MPVLARSELDGRPSTVTGPNFILAGAPKCGTTALFEYLQTHPQVFLTDPKEPHFHADDLGAHQEVPSREEYEKLFRGVRQHHTAVGDGSVWYMHSSVALKRVKAELPNAKLIVMLRHPVELLQSLHSDLMWICFEDEPDFEKAWQLQEARRSGQRIPHLCQVPWFLDYKLVGSLGFHLNRLLDLYSRDQVKIVLFDDFRDAPGKIYEEVLRFLEISWDGRCNFPRVNSRKQSRLRWLARCQKVVVQSLPREWINAGKKVGLGRLSRQITTLNTCESRGVPIRPELRNELIAEFRSDIELLEETIHRDLTHWKATV